MFKKIKLSIILTIFSLNIFSVSLFGIKTKSFINFIDHSLFASMGSFHYFESMLKELKNKCESEESYEKKLKKIKRHIDTVLNNQKPKIDQILKETLPKISIDNSLNQEEKNELYNKFNIILNSFYIKQAIAKFVDKELAFTQKAIFIEKRWKKRKKGLLGAGFSLLLLGGGAVSTYTTHQIDLSHNNAQINDIQKLHNIEKTQLLTSHRQIVYGLDRQLNQTNKQLELLKSKCKCPTNIS